MKIRKELCVVPYHDILVHLDKCRAVSFSKGTERRTSRNRRLKKILSLEVRQHSYIHVKLILFLSTTGKSMLHLQNNIFQISHI